MTNWISVSKMKYWVQKVLPLVYDDSLSYYELLNKVVYKLNQVIENNEKIPDYVAGMIQEFITSGEIESVLANVLANYILNVKNPPEGLTPATGDGTADDTEAIQGCINYANSNGGMAVYFPSGAYLTGSLDIYSGTTIFGYDRYNTRIVLKGGATRPLINGTVDNFTITGVTLDGNMDIQVNNVNLIEVTVGSGIITNAKLTDGFELLHATVNNDLQISDTICDHAVTCAINTDGEGYVVGNNVIFNSLSALLGAKYIELNNSYSSYHDAKFVGASPVGVEINGNYNNITTWSSGAVTPCVDNGTHNRIVIYGVSETVEELNVSGDASIGGNVTVSGNQNVTGNSEVGGNAVFNGNIQYGEPARYNDFLNTVTVYDTDGNPYNVLTLGDNDFDSYLSTFTHIFGNVSEMINYASNLNEGDIVICANYSANDSASAIYKVETSIPTGERGVELSTNKYAILLPGYYVNARLFGAVGDGVTDDYNALQACANYCIAKKKCFFLDEATYLTGTTVNLRYLTNCNIRGKIDGSILIGNSGTTGDPTNLFIQHITGTITAYGMKRGLLDIRWCDVLTLIADGTNTDDQSIAYCTFNLGTVNNINLLASNNSWITENVFNGSRTKKIYLNCESSAITINNNRFYAMCIEGNEEDAGISVNGKSRLNYFECRAEGTPAFSFDNTAAHNTIVKEYRVNEIYNVTDYGNDNVVIYSYFKDMSTVNLYTMDKKNLGDVAGNRIYPTADGFHLNAYAPVYDTGIFPIPQGLTRLRFKSDVPGLIFQLALYDENGDIITTNNNEVGGLGVTYNTTNHMYVLSSPVYAEHVTTIAPKTSKYFKFRVVNGANATDAKYIFIDADIRTAANLAFNKQTFTANNTTPTGTGWEAGDFVFNTTNNNVIGWRYNGSTWAELTTLNLLSKTITITPSTYGQAELAVSGDYVVLAVVVPNSANVIATPFRNGNAWWCKFVMLTSGNAVTSSISPVIYYIQA